MVFRKKRSASSQKEPEASTSTTVSVLQKETDWISNAFRVAELAGAVGGLLPFPYLKGAADLVKALLKPIQQMQQNQDDYKTLTIKVTTILQILHETKKDHEAASDSFNSFEKGCEDFYLCLQDISNNLESFNKSYKLKLHRKYFAADREKESLARYQSQIDECRINLMLRGAVRQNSTDDSDFEKIRLGDLKVLKNNPNGDVEHWEVRWKQESQTRMVRVYKGRDATSKFKAEKEWYSRYRHPNMMQLFGSITSNECRGLVFHNSWCIPPSQFDSRFNDVLGRYINRYHAEVSFDEGLQYLETCVSHHAILSWRDLPFSCSFIGFKGRDDGYLASCYVNLLDGCGLVVFEWLPDILQDIPAYHCRRVFISNISQEKSAKIMERVDALSLSQKSNVPLDPSFLWDICGAIDVFIWKDVSTPAYPVNAGDVLLVDGIDEHNNPLDTSNAAILGFFPCEEPSLLDWFVRDEVLHTKLTIEDCGKHLRIRLPVDTLGILATDDLQTVVIECDLLYSDDAAWERLARAYVSQIGSLHARSGGIHDSSTVCVVTGFSWQIQIPSKLRCSAGASQYKELYFFISKPAARDETLHIYWSLDPSGSERLYCADIDTLGFDSKSLEVYTRRTLRVFDIDHEDFEFIQQAHALLNINPKSDEAARILGLPLVCPIQPESGDVFDDFDQVSVSSESFHTAKGGSVDAHETK